MVASETPHWEGGVVLLCSVVVVGLSIITNGTPVGAAVRDIPFGVNTSWMEASAERGVHI